MAKKMNQKGQMTILIILAVILVGVVVLFFFLEKNPLGAGVGTFDSKQFIEDCVGDSISEAADMMMPQGGFIEPKNFKIYNSTKIEYLCRSYGYFAPCINQHPMLLNEIRTEIKNYIKPRVENCFESMREEIERKGGTFEMNTESADAEISLAPGIVTADINRKITITNKDETVQIFDKFDVRINHQIYNLATLAMTIANNEREYCYFEYMGYMIEDPRIDIRKFVMSDSTIIYTIKDRASGKIFNTAIRGCALTAGL